MNALTKSPCVIRFAPGLWDIYDGSLRRRLPEQYAVLGGSYEDPFYVTDFRPLPPLPGHDGKANNSSTQVQINKTYIDHYINNELKPAGKNMIGAIHSHPGQLKNLSGGYRSGDGDIPSMRATLERAQKLGLPWRYFLAPVITFDHNHTSDEITGWIITLEQKDPIPATIIFEEGAPTAANSHFEVKDTGQILDHVIDHLELYQNRINRIVRDETSPLEDREAAVALLRRLRNRDLKIVETRALELLTSPLD